MNLNFLSIQDYDNWNDFVDNSPQGSIFSYSWYLDALQCSYKILVALEKDEILAGIVLPKNEINTYSNPMLDKYLGVLYKNYDKLSHRVIEKQYKISEQISNHIRKYKSFDYYFHPEFKNWISFYWNGFAQQTRYTYRINLDQTEEDIYSKFHLNIKRNIKHALKNDIMIKENINTSHLFNIINKTFLRQGSKAPFNKSRFETFITELANKNKFVSFGAYDRNNNLLSVAGLVYDNKASYLLLNGIDIDKQVRGANALMIFETIKYFQGKVQWYDFEGSMLKGVEQFYRRFGGELTPYYRIWNDNFFNYAKSKAKKLYKKFRYGR